MWPAWFKFKIYLGWLSLLLGLELISWLSYSYPGIRTDITFSVWVIVLIVSCYRLRYGVYATLAELVIGSQGYILAASIGEFTLSLRLGLFLIVLFAAVIDVVRHRQIFLLRSAYWKWFILLIASLGVGLAVALIFGNSLPNIFYDANGYLFVGLFFAVSQSIRRPEDVEVIFTILIAGVTILTLQTLLIVFVFSHPTTFQYYLTDVYSWIRDFRIGEITRQGNGFYRVFFQSHIYVVFALLLAQISLMRRWQWWSATGMMVTVLLLFLSYSRSFWLATCTLLGIVWAWQWWVHRSQRNMLYLSIITTLGSFIVAYGIILTVVNIPLWGAGSGVSAASLLTERTDNPLTEVAGESRMALLWPLVQKNLEHPVIGSGFGTSVTYATKDPRALASNPNGLYTTYAFEWGYLDLWLKLGVFGLACYALLLGLLVVRNISLAQTITNQAEFRYSALTVAGFGVMAVVLIHALTPYLNHPLGLGWIVLACVISDIYGRQAR